MLPLIQQHQEELQRLCRQYDVQTIYVFGSATTDAFTDTSDIDLLISFKEIPFEQYTDNYFELHEKLEAIFNRKIDLVTERSLSNPYFIRDIEKTRQLLYAA